MLTLSSGPSLQKVVNPNVDENVNVVVTFESLPFTKLSILRFGVDLRQNCCSVNEFFLKILLHKRFDVTGFPSDKSTPGDPECRKSI